MKVLHLPDSCGGNAWGLAQGEKKLGLESTVLVKSDSWLKYPADISLQLQQIRYKSLGLLKVFLTFLRIRKKYDVFHFNFGSSLLHFPARSSFLCQPELPFYPKSAKLFVTYQGCDARQKYKTMQRAKIAACHEAGCYKGMCNSGVEDQRRRDGIEKMSRYARHMWAVNPDLLYFLPPEKSSFLPYSVAYHDDIFYPPKFEKKLRIVHAPTQRECKGSGYILKALEAVQKKYPHVIEVQLVENVPHQKALEIYRQADLIIDQILIGWYGAFAVETMMMGKPVIARIAEADLHFIPEQMAIDLKQSVINADPASIQSVLERCVEDRCFLEQRAQACREYAFKWHSPEYVASITKAAYETAKECPAVKPREALTN